MPTTAIYAGSFDPATIGHMSVIEQISKEYDTVIVLVGFNPEKANTYMFKAEERADIIRTSTKHLRNVKVDIQYSGYTIHYAERHGATAIIRGIRGKEESEEENLLFTFNNRINPDIHTRFVMPDPSIAHVSSSFVKQNCYGTLNWPDIIDQYAPPATKQALLRKQLKDMLSLQFIAMPDVLINKLLDSVESAHARPYHNLEHLANMCLELQEFCQVTEHFGWRSQKGWACQVAVLFHDYYVESDIDKDGAPVGVDAQVKSACALEAHADSLFLRKDLLGAIKDLILDTNYGKDKKITPLSQAFTDADRAILGQPPRIYDKYAAGIRTEYSRHSDEEFLEGRIEFLRRELCRGHIFQTDYFRTKYEDSARANIEREHDQLLYEYQHMDN